MTREQLVALINEQLPNNNQQLITPAALRAVLEAMLSALRLLEEPATPTQHNHDDRYYTKVQLDPRLQQKADLGPNGKVLPAQLPDDIGGGGIPLVQDLADYRVDAATSQKAVRDAVEAEAEARSLALASMQPLSQKGVAEGYAALDASGRVPLSQIPQAALERIVTVANQAARFALTTVSVQNGDLVKEADTTKTFVVVDDTQLGSAGGYTEISVAPPSDASFEVLPSDQDNQAGTFAGDLTGTPPNQTLTLRALANRLASFVRRGALFLPRKRQPNTALDATIPGVASDNLLENIGDVLYWRGQRLLQPLVAIADLANLNARSLLGRSANSTGPMGAIASSAARQAMMSNSAGTAIGFRAFELADLPTQPAGTFPGNAGVTDGPVQVVPGLELLNRNTFSTLYMGARRWACTLLFSTITSSSKTGSGEGTLLGSGIGTKTIPANFLATGAAVRVRVQGRFSSGASAVGTLKLRVKLGATTVAESEAFSFPATQANDAFFLDLNLHVGALSGAGNTPCVGNFRWWSFGAYQERPLNWTTSANINFAASQVVDVTAEFSAAGNTLAADVAEIQVDA